jgi:hypothetical protein
MKSEPPSTRNAIVVVLVLGLGLIALVTAESQIKTNDETSITATGCLQRSDDAGEYFITDENGKHYYLRSESVHLSDHLSHKVTVTGPRVREPNQEKNRYAQLQVTTLRHVGKSCQ